VNGKEQSTHRTITHALDRRLTDVEALFTVLDQRQVDLTRTTADDLQRLKISLETLYATEVVERQQGIHDVMELYQKLLVRQIAFESYMGRSVWKRLRDWWRSRRFMRSLAMKSAA